MRLELKEVGKLVLAAEAVDCGENDSSQGSNFEIGKNISQFAIGAKVITDAGQPSHADDNGDIAQEDGAANSQARKRCPLAQKAIGIDRRCQRVGIVDIHCINSSNVGFHAGDDDPEWDDSDQGNERGAKVVPRRAGECALSLIKSSRGEGTFS